VRVRNLSYLALLSFLILFDRLDINLLVMAYDSLADMTVISWSTMRRRSFVLDEYQHWGDEKPRISLKISFDEIIRLLVSVVTDI
jgi:hypothetical protein